jgi:TetR/AcrR family transcriptional repressor of the ameABC operon
MDRTETVEIIIEKAGKLFRRFGPMKTPVRIIARELNMSPANVYKHFPTKHVLIEAVMERQLETVKTSIIQSCVANTGHFERIRCLAYKVMDYFETTIEGESDYLHIEMVSDVIRFEISGPRNSWEFIKNFHQFLRGKILEYIKDGVACGEMRVEDPEDAAGAVLDSLNRIIEPILLLEDPKPVRVERLERLLRLIQRALA